MVGRPAGRWPRREMKHPENQNELAGRCFEGGCGVASFARCLHSKVRNVPDFLTKRREDRIDYSSYSLQCLLSDTG